MKKKLPPTRLNLKPLPHPSKCRFKSSLNEGENQGFISRSSNVRASSLEKYEKNHWKVNSIKKSVMKQIIKKIFQLNRKKNKTKTQAILYNSSIQNSKRNHFKIILKLPLKSLKEIEDHKTWNMSKRLVSVSRN